MWRIPHLEDPRLGGRWIRNLSFGKGLTFMFTEKELQDFANSIASELRRVRGTTSDQRLQYVQAVTSRVNFGAELHRDAIEVTRVSGKEYREILAKLANHAGKCLTCIDEMGPALKLIFPIEFIEVWADTEHKDSRPAFGTRRPPDDPLHALSLDQLDAYSKVLLHNMCESLRTLKETTERLSKRPVPGLPGKSIRQATITDVSVVEIRVLAQWYRDILNSKPAKNRAGVFHSIVSAYLSLARGAPIDDCYPLIRLALRERRDDS